ncbi:hypothetical protein TW85_06640 [Marinomonas sp. S3726]|uniref:hypothetical protein n=1 Tax=Marinomonas sp. S3726 TaxID=579484 RepID=UPI0005F9F6AB|nr:hypothetical protein [Marinomonas sp. S3726]KJZ15253.1 hypothetical protein TW85_06640 [Marinomonas sp. S3726]
MIKILILIMLLVSTAPNAKADHWWNISMDTFPRLEVANDNELWLAVPFGKGATRVNSHESDKSTSVYQVKLTASSPNVLKSWLSMILTARTVGDTVTVFGPQPGSGEFTINSTRLMITK